MDTGPALNLDQLRNGVQAERFDTVLLAYGDMQGRLQGRRFVAEHFLDGAELREGEFTVTPDFATMRPTPWHEKTALCLGDLHRADGSSVATAPRQVLQTQLERLRERGLEAVAGTQLEFIVFKDGYEDAAEKGYRELTKPTSAEALIARLRREMATSGMEIESTDDASISFRPGPALKTADDHVIFKHGAREIATLEERSITFMARFDERQGSSCRFSVTLRDDEGAVFSRDEELFQRWSAGLRACRRELTLCFAPNVNSYKRPAPRDGQETGADVNPYLALAAIIAAGLHGLDTEPFSVDPRVPSTLGEACALFASSKVALAAFGEEVVAHSIAETRAELEAFGSAVTDWERVRGFERQ